MCMMGSPMLSTMVLSTSVSSPTRVSLQRLFSFLDMSRTMRFIFWKVADTGTMRRDMEMSCSSSVSLRSCRADLVKASSRRPFRSGEAVTMDSVITISPTTAARESSLLRLTLIRLSLWWCTGSGEPPAGAGFGAVWGSAAGAGAAAAGRGSALGAGAGAGGSARSMA